MCNFCNLHHGRQIMKFDYLHCYFLHILLESYLQFLLFGPKWYAHCTLLIQTLKSLNEHHLLGYESDFELSDESDDEETLDIEEANELKV